MYTSIYYGSESFCYKEAWIVRDGYGLFTSLFRNKSSFLLRLKNRLIRKAMHATCRLADRISLETPDVYNYLKEELRGKENEKLVLMLNGFDEELCEQLQIKKRLLTEKENIILAVGRIGAPDKNNEQLLRALETLNLKDWKVVFVGPVETRSSDFTQTIESFYQRNPGMKAKVLFTGAVYDKKELWEWYNRAKVFVHTSPKESYGIVLNEAFYFDNYILSTNVGIASYLINFGYGELLEHNDSDGLSIKLQQIINGEKKLDELLLARKSDSDAITWKKEIIKMGELIPCVNK